MNRTGNGAIFRKRMIRIVLKNKRSFTVRVRTGDGARLQIRKCDYIDHPGCFLAFELYAIAVLKFYFRIRAETSLGMVSRWYLENAIAGALS